MGASFSFEILKLRKRPAVTMLGAILILAVVLLGYFLAYFAIVGLQGDPPPEAEQFLPRLYPENLVAGVLFVLSGVGGVVALILGALSVGSEYGWDTYKTALTQRPDRTEVFMGKLFAVGITVAVFTLAAFAFGAVGSYTVAGLADAPVEWPSLGEMLRGAAAGWLMMAAWAALGAFFATLFRGTALAIGLGLAYALVLENLILGLSLQNETVEKIGRIFLGKNSSDLASSFGDVSASVPSPVAVAEPTQSALVLWTYLAVLLLLATLVFRRRDMA